VSDDQIRSSGEKKKEKMENDKRIQKKKKKKKTNQILTSSFLLAVADSVIVAGDYLSVILWAWMLCTKALRLSFTALEHSNW
jgi:hypothetical protein